MKIPEPSKNPSEKDLTRKILSNVQSPNEKRTVTSFKGLDEEERNLKELMRKIKTPTDTDPTEVCQLKSQKRI